MQTLAQEARELIAEGDVSFVWIPREKNARADAAGNKALDGGVSFLEP
jgi:ribonuclease HI